MSDSCRASPHRSAATDRCLTRLTNDYTFVATHTRDCERTGGGVARLLDWRQMSSPNRHFVACMGLRLSMAAIIFATVGPAGVAAIQAGGVATVNYFSYFTNDSNIIAGVVLVIAAVRWQSDDVKIAWLRGAAVLYMTTTALVDQIILGGGLSGLVVHIIAPIGVLIDWLVFPPTSRVTARLSLAWLGFPAVWIVYTLTRGGLTNWYPYAFVDPKRAGGTIGVMGYMLGISVLILLLARFIRVAPEPRRETSKKAS